MPANGKIHTDPGADCFLRHDPEQARSKAVRQLKTLGYAGPVRGAECEDSELRR